MKLNLAENLKRLRKEREITQEELAGFIGVSFQAVSKWERDEGYPDITILPSIANFFGVTLDELVGMNEIQNSEKREQILKTARKFISEGKLADCVSVLKEGLLAFPNDFEIMADLACFLDGYGSTEEDRKKNRNESIKLSERILEFCTDITIRDAVQANMCFTLWRNGEKERAIEIAKNLPTLYKTAEATLPKFLDGEEKITFCQTAIQKLHWLFWFLINNMVEGAQYSDNEKIELLQKSIAFYEIVYEKEDYAFSNCRLADAYENITVLHLKQNNVDEGLASLEKCVDHCVAFDTLPERVQYTSLLVNTLEYNRQNTSKSTQINNCRYMLDSICNDLKDSKSIYRQCEKEEKFKKIIEKLEATAN